MGRTRAVAVWGTFWVGYCLVRGIPFDRMTQLLMIISAALAFSVGVRGAKVRVAADWLPFFTFLYGYDYSRGAADTFGMAVQVESLYNLELHLFGIHGQIPSLFLQRHLYVADHVQWWESFVALTYCSHFVAPIQQCMTHG